MSVKEEKSALRLQCTKIRNGIATEEKQKRDQKICSLCASLAVFRFAQQVLLYAPIRSEVDIRALATLAWEQGKEVYFPLVDKNEAGKMTFHRVNDFSLLTKGSFGVEEPDADAPLWKDEGKRAVCLIPGLAYGKDGYRLGYGKGYYDRFLNTFSGTGIGITYSELILAEIPHNRFDLQADLLLCEKGVILTREI